MQDNARMIKKFLKMSGVLGLPYTSGLSGLFAHVTLFRSQSTFSELKTTRIYQISQ